MEKVTNCYCSLCNRGTKHIQKAPNHIVHFIITVISAGAWLIFWILLSLSTKKPHCNECGQVEQSNRNMLIEMVIVLLFIGFLCTFFMF